MDTRRLLKRIVTPPLFAVMAVVIVFEELFLDQLRAAVARLARLAPVAMAERWAVGLNRWAFLALFLVPTALLLPVKLAALWFMGRGQPVLGVLVLVAAKIAGTSYAARLFVIGQDKLLSIPAFAWCWARVLVIRHAVHSWIDAVPGIQMVRGAVRAGAKHVRAMLRMLAARRRGWVVARWQAIRRGRR
jgi:hypothetical protein